MKRERQFQLAMMGLRRELPFQRSVEQARSRLRDHLGVPIYPSSRAQIEAPAENWVLVSANQPPTIASTK